MSFSVTILGSSSALPTIERSLTAHLVNHDERFFLIDCGEGTQMQLRRFKTKYSKINHIFISHLHGDHVFGLFGLLSSFSMQSRKAPMYIYSDPKLEEILRTHFNFFNEHLSYEIIFRHINAKKQELIYEDKKFEVLTIPLKHRIPCVGFIFREKPKEKNIKKFYVEELHLSIKDILNIKQGNDFVNEKGELFPNELLTIPSPKPKSYVYCTDTKIHESIIEYIQEPDLLYHESTFLNEDAKLAKETYHSTAKQAAEVAVKTNTKQLLIGHFSQRYKNEQLFLNEAKSIFENVRLAQDGDIIDI